MTFIESTIDIRCTLRKNVYRMFGHIFYLSHFWQIRQILGVKTLFELLLIKNLNLIIQKELQDIFGRRVLFIQSVL